MVGEQIGFDEGGVFESLRDPLWSEVETVTKYRHNKDGVITSKTETVTKMQITGSQALALAVGPPLIGMILGFREYMEDQGFGALMMAGSPVGALLMGLRAAEEVGVAVPKIPLPGEKDTSWVDWWVLFLTRPLFP